MAESTTKTAAKPTRARKAPAKSAASANGKGHAKAKFAKAIEEAKAGAEALATEAKTRAESYREQATAKSKDWLEEAKTYGDQAKTKAAELAVEGKTRASDALSGLGKLVSDNAPAIDDKLGAKYGDYARTASRKMQETAAKIDSKDLDELGEEAREFVRKSPGLAVGMAAVAGFVVARLFSRSK